MNTKGMPTFIWKCKDNRIVEGNYTGNRVAFDNNDVTCLKNAIVVRTQISPFSLLSKTNKTMKCFEKVI